MNPSPRLFQIFCDAMTSLQIAGLRPNLAVAVSGGADSLTTLLLAQEWVKQYQGRVVALSVDHRLRPESSQEIQHLATQLHEYDIEHHILIWHHPTIRSNIQEQARQARYRLLIEWCQHHQIGYLLTGHHLEDQAETVLMQLERGSGVDGLAAMLPLKKDKGIWIIRPLLKVMKTECYAYLQARKIEWIEDPSNKNVQFARAKLRQWLSNHSEKELIIKRLARTAEHMQRVTECLQEVTEKAIQESVHYVPEGYVMLPWQSFNDLSEEIAYRIINNLINFINGKKVKLRFKQTLAIYHHIKHTPFFKNYTIAGCLLSAYQKTIIVTREWSAIKDSFSIGKEEFLWDKRFKIRVDSSLLNKGYTIKPLGKDGYYLLQQEEDKKYSFFLKEVAFSFPTLYQEDRIIACPLLGYNPESLSMSAKMIYNGG